MYRPSISVIIPAYNCIKTFHRCINSILNQTYDNFNLIIIDDGSNDGSSSLCDEYAHLSNVIILHKENGGVSSARNAGIDLSKSEWVTFVDSDDYVENNYLTSFISAVREDVELVAQGMHLHYSKHQHQDSLFAYPMTILGQSESLDLLCSRNFMMGSAANKMFKRNILNNTGLRFDEAMQFKEDERFVIQYINVIKKVAFSPTSAYHYDVPVWGKKYKTDLYTIERSMFSLVLSLTFTPGYQTLHYFINSYAHSVIDSFYTKRDSKNKYKELKNLPTDQKKMIDSKLIRLSLFFPTKVSLPIIKNYIWLSDKTRKR